MNTVCMYFEVHQPYRLKPYGVFNIGNDPFYLDAEKNRQILRKVADKCYIPTTNLLLELAKELGEDFAVSFAITGTAIEQFKEYYPEVLDNFKRLADTGRVEFVGETYYHSLCGLFSDREFREQVEKHRDLMIQEFGQKPRAFRNTELIFNNHIAWLADSLGFETLLMEGAAQVLGWRDPNFVYRHKYNRDLKLLLKNYRLSDDVAFRFSDRNWANYPLNAETFAGWVHGHAGSSEVINLFMDFETFGEHQWADSGIFDFLRALPETLLRHPDFSIRTVSETASLHHPVGDIESEEPVSWADTERDVSAWMGNSIQRQALEWLYRMEDEVRETGDPALLDIYRKFQTSDHFYYMCTKYFNDGDVHKYFSPYDSPYDSYVYFMNAIQDFRQRMVALRYAGPTVA